MTPVKDIRNDKGKKRRVKNATEVRGTITRCDWHFLANPSLKRADKKNNELAMAPEPTFFLLRKELGKFWRGRKERREKTLTKRKIKSRLTNEEA